MLRIETLTVRQDFQTFFKKIEKNSCIIQINIIHCYITVSLTKKLEAIKMMAKEYKNTKECRECGCHFVEKQESIIYECERCIGRHEE